MVKASLRPVFVPIYGVVLLLAAMLGVLELWRAPQWLAGAGLLLAAAAPAAFMLWQRLARPTSSGARTVLVSVLTGLGCVLIMTAVYRYGDTYRHALGAGLVVLVGWLFHVRYIIRPAEAVLRADTWRKRNS